MGTVIAMDMGMAMDTGMATDTDIATDTGMVMDMNMIQKCQSIWFTSSACRICMEGNVVKIYTWVKYLIFIQSSLQVITVIRITI